MQPQPNDQFQPPQPVDQPVQPVAYSPQTFTPQQPSQAVVAPTASAAPEMSTPPDTYVAPDLSVPIPPPTINQPSSEHKGGFMRSTTKMLAVLLVIGGLVAAGFALHGGLTSYNRAHVTTTAVSYIGFLNSGNDAAAYHASSTNLRNAQTETQFSSGLGDLTAKNPKFSDQQVQLQGNKAVYTATVDGLPPTYAGRTDGIFTIALVKHGLASWQVDSVQVQ